MGNHGGRSAVPRSSSDSEAIRPVAPDLLASAGECWQVFFNDREERAGHQSVAAERLGIAVVENRDLPGRSRVLVEPRRIVEEDIPRLNVNGLILTRNEGVVPWKDHVQLTTRSPGMDGR